MSERKNTTAAETPTADDAMPSVGTTDGFEMAAAERRLMARLAGTLRKIAVVVGDKTLSATIVNLSSTGFCVALAEPLPLGGEVTVNLGDGVARGCAVVWSNVGEAGLRLIRTYGHLDPGDIACAPARALQ